MKTVLISGGSDGIGKALAAALAKNNQVTILAPEADRIAAVAQEVGCDFAVADISDYAQIQNAVMQVIARHQKIDVLINNAGIWIEGPLELSEPARIKRVMEVNATGTILLTRAVLPYMKKEKRGRIINVISQSGILAKPFRSIYDSSKWAITGFTKCLSEELKGSGITVSGFYPAAIKTNLFASAGVPRDTSNYMEVADVVRAMEFLIDTSDDLEVPELGIKPAWY